MTSSWDIHIAEDETDFMRIAYTDIRGAWSTDGGGSWYIGSDGIPSEWANTNYDLVKDEDTGILWGTFSGLHDIPSGWSINSWNRTGSGGVAFSSDNGRTWTTVSGLPDKPFTSMAIDYTSSPSSRRLYAAVWSDGVWCSEDGGATWQRRSDGLDCGDGTSTEDGPNTHIVQVEVQPSGRVFALKTKYIRPGSVIRNDGGLWASDDNGESWDFLSETVPECTPVGWIDTEGQHSWADPISFTLDSDNPDHIWVCAANVNNGKVQGGLYESTDGGTSWERTYTIYGGFRLTNSDHYENVLYLATMGDGVHISTDGGASWTEDADFPFSNPTRITEDPFDESIIWVNTFGGGVFKGALAGEDLHEDSDVTSLPEKIAIHAYPNPFNRSCLISIVGADDLDIFDTKGRLIEHITGSSAIWTPQKSIPSGIYILRTSDIEKQVSYIK